MTNIQINKKASTLEKTFMHLLVLPILFFIVFLIIEPSYSLVAPILQMFVSVVHFNVKQLREQTTTSKLDARSINQSARIILMIAVTLSAILFALVF